MENGQGRVGGILRGRLCWFVCTTLVTGLACSRPRSSTSGLGWNGWRGPPRCSQLNGKSTCGSDPSQGRQCWFSLSVPSEGALPKPRMKTTEPRKQVIYIHFLVTSGSSRGCPDTLLEALRKFWGISFVDCYPSSPWGSRGTSPSSRKTEVQVPFCWLLALNGRVFSFVEKVIEKAMKPLF